MGLERLDHFTIRLRPDDLARSRQFYVDVLGLSDGRRPASSLPGHWLYCGQLPVVRLAGMAGAEEELAGAGRIEHIAFRATGLQAMLARLREHGIAYRQEPVPAEDRFQVFVTDPNGVEIALSYSAEEARERDH